MNQKAYNVSSLTSAYVVTSSLAPTGTGSGNKNLSQISPEKMKLKQKYLMVSTKLSSVLFSKLPV